MFEEGLLSVKTVRDFTTIFDAYAKHEESLLSAKMEQAEESAADGDDFGLIADDSGIFPRDDPFTLDDDIELRVSRLQHLLERRPLLLNAVLLRQNPHNVQEWINRTKIYRERNLRDKVPFHLFRNLYAVVFLPCFLLLHLFLFLSPPS